MAHHFAKRKLPDVMLNLDTIVHAPDMIRGRRNPFTGRLEERYNVDGDYWWIKFASLMENAGIEMMDGWGAEDVFKALSAVGVDDTYIVCELFDDPNAVILVYQEKVQG